MQTERKERVLSCLPTGRRVTAPLQTLLQASLTNWNYWQFSCLPLFPVAVGNGTRLSHRLVLRGSRAGTGLCRRQRCHLGLLHWALGSQVLVEPSQNLLLFPLLPEGKNNTLNNVEFGIWQSSEKTNDRWTPGGLPGRWRQTLVQGGFL